MDKENAMSPLTTASGAGMLTAKMMAIGASVPFFLITKDSKHGLNWTRIAEALIIAAVAGMVSGYVNDVKTKAELEGLKADVVEVKGQVKQIYMDIYKPSVGR